MAAFIAGTGIGGVRPSAAASCRRVVSTRGRSVVPTRGVNEGGNGGGDKTEELDWLDQPVDMSKLQDLLPKTGVGQECFMCEGKGKHTCFKCRGSGKVARGGGDGGEYVCTNCEGAGMLRCELCHGMGVDLGWEHHISPNNPWSLSNRGKELDNSDSTDKKPPP